MKVFSRKLSPRVSLIVLGALGAALTACGGMQGGSPTFQAQAVAAPQGLTLAGRAPSVYLANGDGFTILSPALGRNVLATVTYDPGAVVGGPAAWAMIPGTLHVKFVPALGPAHGNEPGVRAVLRYPHASAPAVRAGWAMRVIVDYAGGKQLAWVAFGRFEERELVSVDLPASLLAGATGITLGLGTSHVRPVMETPGPRYWTGTAWSKTGTIESGKKTVVLIHGIFSSVESAFPTARPGSTATPCAQLIANAGHFDQVLGFDYKWNEPPSSEGPRFADFLKQIAAAGVDTVAIEAHSYGSVVTLAAIPDVVNELKVSDVVTLGGPLPLRGTPLALPDNLWRMGMVMGLLDVYFNEPPDVVTRAFKSGMIASLATDSPDLRKIILGIRRMRAKPHFIEVAGTQWVTGEKIFERQLIEGSGVQLPWDGVVETLAAESTNLPNPTSKEFDLSHIDLECNAKVIDWVGTQVHPSL
jgi:pimeloyl-ACP methyl ester carboxylesterase